MAAAGPVTINDGAQRPITAAAPNYHEQRLQDEEVVPFILYYEQCQNLLEILLNMYLKLLI